MLLALLGFLAFAFVVVVGHYGGRRNDHRIAEARKLEALEAADEAYRKVYDPFDVTWDTPEQEDDLMVKACEAGERAYNAVIASGKGTPPAQAIKPAERVSGASGGNLDGKYPVSPLGTSPNPQCYICHNGLTLVRDGVEGSNAGEMRHEQWHCGACNSYFDRYLDNREYERTLLQLSQGLITPSQARAYTQSTKVEWQCPNCHRKGEKPCKDGLCTACYRNLKRNACAKCGHDLIMERTSCMIREHGHPFRVCQRCYRSKTDSIGSKFDFGYRHRQYEEMMKAYGVPPNMIGKM